MPSQTKIDLPEADKNGVTTVTYQGGKFGPHATDKKQAYMKLKPSEDTTLSYEVFFPKGFDFNRGGKLPGLASDKAISGGNKATNDYSVRLMWRTKGQGEAYSYVPPSLQIKEYYSKCTESNAQYGDSIGRGSFTFVCGDWNKIKIRTKLNTPGKHDGIIQVYHNEKKEIDMNCVCFRQNKNVLTSYMMFSTFYGGSTQDWAPEKTNIAKFRNFVIT